MSAPSGRSPGESRRASPGGLWREAEVAAAFREHRRQVIPLLDAQEELVRELVVRGGRRIDRFCDLGAGDGAFAQLVMDAEPDATGVLVDFSASMLDAARDRLAEYAGRWTPVAADLSRANWQAALPAGRFDAIVSGFCVHHLPDERKRELYAEVFELLEPGGIFLNCEHVAADRLTEGLFEEHVVRRLIELEQRRPDPRPDDVVKREFRKREEAEEDRPQAAEVQTEWLREIGFEDVGVFFKWPALAVFGGLKPRDEGSE